MSKEATMAKNPVKSLLANAIFLLICVGLIITLQIGFIFFVFALLPSLVAFFIDDSRKKYVYKTVLACNLAGMLPTLMEFSQSKLSVASLEMTMSNPKVWLIAYGAAAGGWMLVWCCRAVAIWLIAVTCQNKISSLERAKKEMIEEWGMQIKRGV